MIENGANPFLSSAWLGHCGLEHSVYHFNNTSAALSRFSMKGLRGVKILATPPWALDCGLSIDCPSSDFESLTNTWLQEPEAIKIIDLPPSDLNSSLVKNHTPSGFKIQWRHTRQLDLNTPLPSTRRKQIKRADKAGITCKIVKCWAGVAKLHAESRSRKNINSNNTQLAKLLEAISHEPFSFAVEATNSDGKCIASGGFIFVSPDICLYSFGGQIRSQHSGIASVSMLSFAMTHALENGATTFDFGGSSDPGVDRFYKEFDAKTVAKARLISVAWWLRPFIKLLSPFSKTAKILN